MAGLLNLAKAAGNIPAPKPSNDLLRAFHGSPHDFDKFSIDEIGTGEGAQAYGHGLYFAEKEGVARSYRDALTNRKGPNITYKGKGFKDLDGPEYRALTQMEREIKFNRSLNTKQVKEQALTGLRLRKKQAMESSFGSDSLTMNRVAKNHDEDIAALERMDPDDINFGGKMYEVEIDASTNDLIEYEKLWNEQPKLVQDALKDSLQKKGWDDATITDYMADVGFDDAKDNLDFFDLEAELASRGVKGVRYKDAFSRGTEGGSQNYVIFDDRIINISKKYGIPIPAAAAMLAGQSEEAEAGPIAAGARRIIDPRFSQPIGGGAVRKGLIDPMGTLGAEITPRGISTGPSFQLSDFEGQPYIISQSDRSAAGGILNAVGGTQIDPVDLRGGRDFMFENPGMAWASDPKVVNSLLERATKLKEGSGQNPLLLPYTMAPTGIDFATMPLDTMINFARSNMSKTNIKKLDRKIKKIIPKWGGVANPGSNAIFRDSTGDQRKMVADLIDKQFKDVKGGLSIAEARAVTSDANQYRSNDGSMVNIGRIDASRPAIADSGHPTYKGGLPGEGVGTFQEPLDIRKFIANNGRVVTNKPSDIRAASMNPALTQGIIDEKLLRAQEGSINPRLLGGIAAGSAATAAAPTLADQGAGLLDFLANAAQGAIAPISNAPNTIIQALTSDRSNEQLKADRDQRLAQNDYQLRTDLGQQYTQNAQQTMGGLLQSLAEQAERSRIVNAAKNSRILQTIPNAYNQLPERGRIVGNALLDSFL